MERILTVGGNQASRPITDFLLNSGYGKDWYVNNLKSASGDGKSWNYPFITITEAVALASAGDRINIWGDGTTTHQYTETVTPLVSSLKFIAANPLGVIWGGVTDSLILATVVNTYIGGIRFRPTNGYAGISMTGASNMTFVDTCRFQGTTGSKYGIKSDGHQSGVRVYNSHFLYFNAATCYGLYGIIDAGVAENASWEIIGNMFHSNTYHIKGNFRYSIVKGNTLAGYGLLAAGSQGAPTKCIDFTPGSGSVGNNTVTKNMLGGAYTTALYVSSNANEDWIGNYCAVTATTGPYGLTVAVPAA
jgi:hypothetical protein